MLNNKTHLSKQSGFTLVELAIVLVIIGLLVGGVLVGQDLIKGAEINAVVTQKESYDAAVNTFRGKYNQVPGDISNGAQFNLSATGQAATTGNGDGNRLIESAGTTGVVGYLGEPVMMFRHLSETNLIEGNVTVTSYATNPTISDTTMPAAKNGKGNRIYPMSSGGLNYFLLAGFTGAVTATTAAFGTAPSDALTPTEAFQIDSKIDDGVANTGTVRPITIATGATSIAAAGEASATDAGATGAGLVAGQCWDTASNLYATATAATVNAPGCQLRIRSSF